MTDAEKQLRQAYIDLYVKWALESETSALAELEGDYAAERTYLSLADRCYWTLEGMRQSMEICGFEIPGKEAEKASQKDRRCARLRRKSNAIRREYIKRHDEIYGTAPIHC